MYVIVKSESDGKHFDNAQLYSFFRSQTGWSRQCYKHVHYHASSIKPMCSHFSTFLRSLMRCSCEWNENVYHHCCSMNLCLCFFHPFLGLRLDVHASGTSMYTVMPVPRTFLSIHNPEKSVTVRVRGPDPSPSAGEFKKRISLQLFYSPIINCQEVYSFSEENTSVNVSCTLYSNPSGKPCYVCD